MRFVFVEPIIKIGSKEPRALRRAKCDRTFQGTRRNRKLRSRAVFQLRNRVPNARQTKSCDRRILGFEHDFINLLRLEAGAHANATSVSGEFPLVSRNCPATAIAGIAYSKDARGVLRIGDGLSHVFELS